MSWSGAFRLVSLQPASKGEIVKMFRKAIVRLIDPFGIIRNNIVQPLFVLYDQYRESTLDNVREVLIRLAVILFVFACVFWAAIFFYVTFYYSYMPQIAHMRPVYMQYK